MAHFGVPAFSVMVVLGAAIVTGSACSSGESDEAEYESVLLDVQAAVAAAGFDVAEGLVAVDACETDEDCVTAGALLFEAYGKYVPEVKSQLSALEAQDVPPKYGGLHDAYVEQLRLRIQAGELFIEGWNEVDDRKLQDSFRKFREAQSKLGEILEEVEALR